MVVGISHTVVETNFVPSENLKVMLFFPGKAGMLICAAFIRSD